MKTKSLIFLLCLIPALIAAVSVAPVQPPKPFGAIPSERQLRWHELETYGFVHFTTNTFTDKEWGYGDEDPEIITQQISTPIELLPRLKPAD